MKKLISVIIDPAHGSDVPGKRSPNGLHREYFWSRQVSQMLSNALTLMGYDVHFTNTTDLEIGLSKRVKVANSIIIPAGNTKFLVSIHNNAAGDGTKWLNATGVEIWTTKGKTKSDDFAEAIFKGIETRFSDLKTLKYRYDKSDGDKDKENNWTVLTGRYSAVLIEWLFQDNKEDVVLLGDMKMNMLLIDAIIDGIEAMNEVINEATNNK